MLWIRIILHRLFKFILEVCLFVYINVIIYHLTTKQPLLYLWPPFVDVEVFCGKYHNTDDTFVHATYPMAVSNQRPQENPFKLQILWGCSFINPHRLIDQLTHNCHEDGPLSQNGNQNVLTTACGVCFIITLVVCICSYHTKQFI